MKYLDSHTDHINNGATEGRNKRLGYKGEKFGDQNINLDDNIIFY